MKKIRIALLTLSLLSIVSIVLMAVFSQAIQEGKMAKDWIGVVGLLMSGSMIANVFLTYRYAWRTGRQAGLWALGAFLLPYAAPLLLSFLPEDSSGAEIYSNPVSDVRETPANSTQYNHSFNRITKKELFTSIPEPTRIFRHKEGLFQSSQWPLDQLRLFCIIVPGSFKWRIVTSSQDQWFFSPIYCPQRRRTPYMVYWTNCPQAGTPMISQ